MFHFQNLEGNIFSLVSKSAICIFTLILTVCFINSCKKRNKMFYHLEILKKTGPFYPLWLADTYPRRFLRIPESKIWSYNIYEICENLTEIVRAETMNPKKRFSLRLSARLTYGVVKLYERQSHLLLHSVFSLNMAITKRRTVEEEKPKRKQKKATSEEQVRKEVNLQAEEQLLSKNDVIKMLEISSQRVQNTEITLRENMLVQAENKADNFGEEEDPMQIFQQENLLKDLHLVDSLLEQSREVNPTVIVCTADVHRENETSKENNDLPAIQDVTLLEKTNNAADVSVMDPLNNMEISKVVDETMRSNQEHPVIPEIEIVPAPQNIIEDIQVQENRGEKRDHTTINLDETPELDLNVSLPVPKKRKHVVKDAHIILPHEYMKVRLLNPRLEQRCKIPLLDAVNLEGAISEYRFLLSYKAFNGRKFPFELKNLAAPLRNAFARNLNTRPVPNDKSGFTKLQPIETVRADRDNDTTRNNLSINAVTIDDHHVTLPPNVNDISLMVPSPTHKSLLMTTHDRSMCPDISVPELDISRNVTLDKTISNVKKHKGKPVSILHTTMDEIRQDISKSVSFDVPEKRRKTVSKKTNLNEEETLNTAVPDIQMTETNQDLLLKDNGNITVEVQPEIVEKTMEVEEHIQKDKEQSGNETMKVEEHIQKDKEQSGNETMLGSLDRTDVNLGDETLTPESKAVNEYLQSEWGNVGVWEKIMLARKARCHPLNVEVLVRRAQIPDNVSRRRVAVTAFKVILFLKKYRFINVLKDPETLKIVNIKRGEAIKEMRK